jgi:hypothetical protein
MTFPTYPGAATSLLVTCMLLLGAAPARAAGGHDHGDAPAVVADSALPRFAATSELFELVGVIDGRKVTLYLDYSATNAPVKDARLELEIGGQKLTVSPHAAGEFEATLAQALPVGVTSVTATVITPKDSDLLAGEIDLHEAPHNDAEKHVHSRTEQAGWVLGGLTALGLLVWLGRRVMGRRQALAGGAA